MNDSKIIRFIRYIYAGRTIYRFLFDSVIESHIHSLRGSVLDLGANRHSPYYRFFSHEAHVTASNYFVKDGVDTVIDISKKFPLGDGIFDSVLCFNTLYIPADRQAPLSEMRRVLKPGGQLILSMPFIANEMPEPTDYCRLSYQGLEYELNKAGFSAITVIRFGERCTSAAYLLHPLYFFNTIRLVAYGLALLGDKLLPASVKRNHPTPLGYIVIAQK
jgi:SAM-dependent methyltransferase